MHNRRLSGNAVADGDHSPHHETARAHTFRYQCPAHRPAQAHTAQCSVCGARCAPSLTPQESSKNLCQARFESFGTRPHRGRTLPAGCPPLSPNSQRHVCVCIMCKPHGSHWAPPSLVSINAMYLERSRERCHLQAVTRALACQCCVGVGSALGGRRCRPGVIHCQHSQYGDACCARAVAGLGTGAGAPPTPRHFHGKRTEPNVHAGAFSVTP